MVPAPPVPTPVRVPTPHRSARCPTQNGRLIAIVFLPFAAGYYLSYLFRSINAPISAHLTSDLTLGAADLGLLTSVYFLTFAAAQIPIGVLLDRYGPRRIQSMLLLVAAAGAALFGMAETFVGLGLARAMIGLGVAAALMAGLKAIVLWFPRERVARGIAQLMRMGWFRPVHAKSIGSREVRALLVARKQLLSKLMDLEASMRGILRGFGLKMGIVTRKGFEARVRELSVGHAMLERIMRAMLAARAALWREFDQLHREMLRIVRDDEICRRLMTIPGVGEAAS